MPGLSENVQIVCEVAGGFEGSTKPEAPNPFFFFPLRASEAQITNDQICMPGSRVIFCFIFQFFVFFSRLMLIKLRKNSKLVSVLFFTNCLVSQIESLTARTFLL